MRENLKKAILKVVLELWPESQFRENEIEVGSAPAGFGDYASNIGFKLSAKIKKSPTEIANEIKEKIETEKLLKNRVEKIEVASGGFLNFFVSENYLLDLIGKINQQKEKFGNLNLGKGKKVHLDFVSANPTGPLHFGNFRGGPLGDALANVLEKSGFTAFREYYVNDLGNQIKVLGHSVLKDDKAQYRGEYIDELRQKLGLEQKKEEEISQLDPFEIGEKAAQEILENIIKPALEKSGISFDSYFSEKSLWKKGKIEAALNLLLKKGFVYKKDGALWFRSTDFGDDKDRVVKKSTGEYSYFGSDIAYHQSKFERGSDWAIDIWGADHHGDVKRILGAMEALGYGGKVKVILVQFVKLIKDGQELKMSKRRGTYVTVEDVLEEVGKDAVRFFLLMYSPNSKINFDLDLAKEKSDKNPVFYVQYAHARIASILEKAGQKRGKTEKGLIFETEKELPKKLSEEKIFSSLEKDLAIHLARFPELIEDIAQNLEVHQLTHYAIQLADKFHRFYHSQRVIDEKDPTKRKARLALIGAVKIVLAETLRLLGVSVPRKM